MKRLTCFSKRDFGGIILVGVGIAELLLSFLLFLSLKINEKTLLYGVVACVTMFGVGYFLSYLSNARTRFRPCWYLPFGILLICIGVFAILFKVLKLNLPSISISTVVVCVAGFNFIVSMASSLQLKALCLVRWVSVALYGCLNGCYALLLYFNVFGIKNNEMFCIAVYLILLALETLFEPFYIFKKDKIKNED